MESEVDMKILMVLLAVFSGSLLAGSYDSYVGGDFVKAMEQLKVEMPTAKPDEVESRLKMAWDIFSQTPAISGVEIKRLYETLGKNRVNEFLYKRIEADRAQWNLFDKEDERDPLKWSAMIDEVWKMKSHPLEYNHEKQSRARVLSALLRRKRTQFADAPEWIFLMGKLDEARGWDGTKDIAEYLQKEKNPEAGFMKEAKKIITDKRASAFRESKITPVLPLTDKKK
jgi:hypothetical protein